RDAMPLATALTFTKLLDTIPAGDSSGGAASLIFFVFFLAIAVFYIAAGWRIFTKAGRPGWAILIPIYSTIVLLQITGHSGWTFLLFLIPIVGLVFGIFVLHDLSKAFGHGAGFTLGLLFLSIIFYPILGFGSSKYVGKPA
ncbi:MAG TPA: DUF5684 domain-containing protein, partial [Ktedonobacterales bacterium]